MVPAASKMVVPGKLATKPTNSIAWGVVESTHTDLLSEDLSWTCKEREFQSECSISLNNQSD